MRKIKNLNTELTDLFGNTEFLDESKKVKLTLYHALIGALNVRHQDTSDEDNLLNGEYIFLLRQNLEKDEVECSIEMLAAINKAVKRVYSPFITAQIVRLLAEG